MVAALGALVLRWRERRERQAWLGPLLLLVFNAFLLLLLFFFVVATTIGGDRSLWLWLASSMRPLLARPVRRVFASLLLLLLLLAPLARQVARFPPCKVVVVGQRLAPRTDPPHAHRGKHLRHAAASQRRRWCIASQRQSRGTQSLGGSQGKRVKRSRRGQKGGEVSVPSVRACQRRRGWWVRGRWRGSRRCSPRKPRACTWCAQGARRTAPPAWYGR